MLRSGQVCAPSNAAVDVLVERLLHNRLRDSKGLYTPDMLRVGSPSACRYAGVCWRMLAYAGVCWRMLAYADVC